MKKLKGRRKVALMIETSRSYGRSLLRGIARYSRTNGNWSLLHEEMTIDDPLPKWMAEAGISGVIARVDSHSIGPLRELGVPLVDVRCRQKYTSIPQVETDDRLVAQFAFEHLWERGFRRFAYCGFRGAHFSEIRLRHFRECTEGSHCSLAVYESPGQENDSITSIERTGAKDSKSTAQWLASLEPATGLFVCNDIRGQQVLNACRSLGILVPDDIAVVGVDDDDAICPLSDPPLSSVRPDAERVGYEAASMLEEIMNGRPATSSMELIPPAGVAQRLSTQVTAVEDREIARVCRFIREHACDRINVDDIVQFSKLSRRQLERRFRTLLNRTPHEELTSAQIARVSQLLQETSMTLEQIAHLAGFSHRERLGVVFKRETGLTPGEYRLQNRLDV